MASQINQDLTQNSFTSVALNAMKEKDSMKSLPGFGSYIGNSPHSSRGEFSDVASLIDKNIPSYNSI